MARIIHGDDLIFNAMENGRSSALLNNYVAEQWNQVGGLSNLVSSTIMQGVQNLVQRINDTDVYALAEAALSYVANLWGQDIFQPLETLSKIQHAPNCMLPYLMAQPDIRKLHIAGSCEAYGNRYLDMTPGAMETNHEEWRMVMSGLMNINEETDEWEATTYFQLDDRYNDAEPLSHYQSMVIRDAWAQIAEAINKGVDPTSCWNSDL